MIIFFGERVIWLTDFFLLITLYVLCKFLLWIGLSLTDYVFDAVPPRIEEGPRLMTGTVGSTARIPCNTTGEPRPEITWLKDGRLIREAGKYIVEDSGTLVINSLDVSCP